jgi:hypothetical protein
VVKIQVKAFWVIMPCSVKDDNGGSMVLQNIGILSQQTWHYNLKDLDLNDLKMSVF